MRHRPGRRRRERERAFSCPGPRLRQPVPLVINLDVGEHWPQRVRGAIEGEAERAAYEAACTITADHELRLDGTLLATLANREQDAIIVLLKSHSLGCKAEVAQAGTAYGFEQQPLDLALLQDQQPRAVGLIGNVGKVHR
jgi:hypothetical protein